jgi:hypothetical protein
VVVVTALSVTVLTVWLPYAESTLRIMAIGMIQISRKNDVKRSSLSG